MTGRAALFCGAILASLALFPPSRAEAGGISAEITEQLRTFSTCAGRMMALRDHLALFGGPEVDRAEVAREAHVSILEALLDLALADGFDGRRVTGWRIEARAAQSAVLSQADFGTTPERRARARVAADRHIAQCNRLILGV
jgi:hypothetical protein